MIRRIEVDKVANVCLYFVEIANVDSHSLQRPVTGPQNSRLTDGRLFRAPHRHIELAFGVDAPQAVEASLVEVDETGRYLNAVVEIVLTSDAVVVVFGVICRVLAQLLDEGFGIALDDLVCVDEIKVDIT